MGNRVPSLTPRQVIAALQRAGFVVRRQRGSHITLKNPERSLTVAVPFHSTDLPRGTLMAILKQARITPGEFLKLL